VKAKSPWKDHPYRELAGEALDNHMMAMHGWTMQMVVAKGTQTPAQELNFIGSVHRKGHHLEEPSGRRGQS